MVTKQSSTNITVTTNTFNRIARIQELEGAQKMLRVAVLGGGCSGFQYDFKLEDKAESDDLVITQGSASVIIDPVSQPFLENSVIDYTQELIGARFVVQNPNATSSCGCGISFSL